MAGHVFLERGSVVCRAALSVDDATWARARGWALTRVRNIPYYKDTYPEFAADGLHTIEEVLADG